MNWTTFAIAWAVVGTTTALLLLVVIGWKAALLVLAVTMGLPTVFGIALVFIALLGWMAGGSH
jgi:hypothetical protein